ncbi:metal ABC transporter solute-binding protein, Zn/Mn family [Microbacterium paludicola]|uniref:metal ABC transporter solute-binding protein, Zn/Mn family n=1 Tax=Microbacterium paludicola TaxID=300019 RepID=UPI00119E1455|nr:zinc ABC transporter substrate-binding protein [Microbacterium paludicola]
MQKLRAAALLTASAVVLAGCSSTASGSDDGDGTIRIVASTNVYGDIAAQIGGDRVEVTTIIDSASQDPHSYEATARDRLAVQDADVVAWNGGGYDAFIETLLDGSDAHVFTAAEFSHDHPDNGGHDAGDDHADEDAEAGHDHEEDGDHSGHDHIEGFNEHVWFDPHTMIHVVEGMAEELGELDEDGAADFTAAAADIIADLEAAEAELETIKADADGAGIFMTEPLPGYIAASAGLTDLTPAGFAEAVEEGTDVSPATLLDALEIIDSGDVKVVLTNAQTGGAETQRIEEAAEAAGIPVVAFTELLADGSSYSEWMHDAIQSLADALRS